MFNSELFIRCVEERPALWDKKDKEYTLKAAREQMWTEIASIMFQDFHQLQSKVQVKRVKLLKNKWRHIRDTYIKVQNQMRKGNKGVRSRKRRYIHADLLKFLANCTRSKGKQPANPDGEEENAEDSDGEEDDDEFGDRVFRRSTEAAQVNRYYQDTTRSLQATSSTYNRNFTSARQNVFPENVEVVRTSCKAEPDDADKLFLMSILPDYKKLNEEEQIDFRILVLQYFRDVRQRRNSQPLAGISVQQLHGVTLNAEEREMFLDGKCETNFTS